MDRLFKEKTVDVTDPFAGRQYAATVESKSSTYREGRHHRTYYFEVKELDEATPFERLEIEGHAFSVIRNTETFHNDYDVIGIHTLLRLSPSEFRSFQSLIRPGPIEIRRVSIDDEPIVRRFGGGLYWSEHEEESLTSYKQIARFYPTDDLPKQVTIAGGREQAAYSRMILDLTGRFAALLDELIKAGQVSKEVGDSLMSADWRVLVGDDRANAIRSRLEKVDDAESELD